MQQNEIIEKHQEFLNKIVATLEECGVLKYTCSAIISGSFGRNEPTYRIENDRDIVYESDVEMALVYSSLKNMARIKGKTKDVIEKFPQVELELMPISKKRLVKQRNYNYSTRSTYYKTLFTYDFYNGSRTLWGQEFLKQGISKDRIDPFEGKRIVGNRIAELEYNKCHKSKLTEVMRWKAKVILALGTAFLIENKQYSSSYETQKEDISLLQSQITKFFGPSFYEDYEWAYSYLRKGELVTYTRSEDVIRGYVKIMYNYYSIKKIRKPKTGCFYIFIREAFLLLKYYPRYIKYCFNPRNLIYESIMHSYYQNSFDTEKWAMFWKRVLN